MSSCVWTPLDSIDDDALALESAALLSLLAQHRMDRLSMAQKEWSQVQHGLTKGKKNPELSIEALGLLRKLLKLTGLELPSGVRTAPGSSSGDVFREVRATVSGQTGNKNSPQAALALLNLACDESLSQAHDRTDLLDDGLILIAWKIISDFTHALNSIQKSSPERDYLGQVEESYRPHDPNLFGDYQPWSLGIGPMVQTLQGWESSWLMADGMLRDQHATAITYWTPLPHLALGYLGWSDPAIGIARWILLRMPDDTPELHVLRRVWGTDALMYFSHAQGDWIPQSTGNSGLHYETSGLRISALFEKSENAEKYNRCGGLHIQEHLKWQMFRPEFVGLRDMRLYSMVERGRKPNVVLELEAMAGWRSQLEIAKGRFWSEFQDPELEVTILAPPVGRLGTFRRSPATRLWFSGSHEAHLLGQKERKDIHSTESSSTAGVPDASPIKGYKNAAVFWLAGELCRRQHGYLLRSYSQPDFGDGLRLSNTAGPTVLISRDGAIWTEGIKAADAVEIYMSDNKRALLADLEKKLGIPVRDKSAATTARTVVYRAMAHILGLAVGEKAHWDFVAVDELEEGSIWQLVRDGKAAATLMPNGDVLQASGTTNLMHRYKAHSRRLTAMVGEVFGSLLP